MNSGHDSKEGLVKFKRNSVIFTEGESSTYLYIIKSGKIRIVKEDGKRFLNIATLGKQDFIGELSIFSDEPRSASAYVVEDTEVVLVKKSEMRKIIKSCPPWVSEIVTTMASRLLESLEVLREHKIEDDSESGPLDLKEVASIRKAIDEYKKRRGIS